MIEMIKSNKLSGRTKFKTIPIKSYDHWKMSTRMCTMFYVPILITRFRIQKFFSNFFISAIVFSMVENPQRCPSSGRPSKC